jgi:protein ImuB
LVIAANGTARTFGVTPGMPVSQASTLCPNAHVLLHDPHEDIEAIRALAESAQCFSPIAGIEQLDSNLWAGRSLHQPQSILIDVTGISPLFGGEDRLAQAISQWTADRGLLASIAIAHTTGAAWALANYSCRTWIAQRLIEMENASPLDKAHSASSESIAILPADQPASSLLFSFPIEALRLDQVTVTKLHRLGIRTIGPLAELPRSGLTSRFGPSLLERMDQALNGKQETISALHATPSLSIEETLEHPTPVRETIDGIVWAQIQKLVKVLDQMGHGAVRIVCRIVMERNAIAVEAIDLASHSATITEPTPNPVHVIQLGLYQPSNDANHIAWLLQGQLDAQFEKQTYRGKGESYWVKSIGLQATLTAPIVWQQSDLFEREQISHRDAIARLIDSLSSRLGRTAVLAATYHRDPLPEHSYSWRPLTGYRKDGIKQQTKRKIPRSPHRNFAEDQGVEPSVGDVWRRPIRFYSPAKKLHVVQNNDKGKPTVIVHQGIQDRIVSMLGPERIESGWWKGAMHQRDYYRTELASGVWLWLYLDRRASTWYLHGEFD